MKNFDYLIDEKKYNIFFLNNKKLKLENKNNLVNINVNINFLNSKKNINYKFIKKFNKYLLFINKMYIKHKLYTILKKNLLIISRGYCIILNIIGLGFTVTIWKLKYLRFNIGYNHLIYYKIPENVLIRSKYRRNIYLYSSSYFILKKIVIEIKNFRRLSVYKLKGIKEKNELYKKKNWKKGSF